MRRLILLASVATILCAAPAGAAPNTNAPTPIMVSLMVSNETWVICAPANMSLAAFRAANGLGGTGDIAVVELRVGGLESGTQTWYTAALNASQATQDVAVLQAGLLTLTQRVEQIEGGTQTWNQAAADAASATGSVAVVQSDVADLTQRVATVESGTQTWYTAAFNAAQATQDVAVLQAGVLTLTQRVEQIEGGTQTWNQAAADAASATTDVAQVQADVVDVTQRVAVVESWGDHSLAGYAQNQYMVDRVATNSNALTIADCGKHFVVTNGQGDTDFWLPDPVVASNIGFHATFWNLDTGAVVQVISGDAFIDGVYSGTNRIVASNEIAGVELVLLDVQSPGQWATRVASGTWTQGTYIPPADATADYTVTGATEYPDVNGDYYYAGEYHDKPYYAGNGYFMYYLDDIDGWILAYTFWGYLRGDAESYVGGGLGAATPPSGTWLEAHGWDSCEVTLN